jgi:hypothetical protein
MAYVCFFENHQPRSTMPLSSHTRRRPHKYAVRVTAHIVETSTTMGSKEFERACDFCKHCISIAQICGYTNGDAEDVPALGAAKEPKENPITKRFGATLHHHRVCSDLVRGRGSCRRIRIDDRIRQPEP